MLANGKKYGSVPAMSEVFPHWGRDEIAYAAAIASSRRPVVAGKERGDWGEVASSTVPDPDGKTPSVRVTAEQRAELERLFLQFGGPNNPPRLCDDIAAAMSPPRHRRAVADALDAMGLRIKARKRGRPCAKV